jgi:hypothetical protein
MNGSGFSLASDGALRPHSSTIGAPHRSRARASYGAQLRELFGEKQSGSARGCHPMVLGGGFGSSRASGGILLLCFEGNHHWGGVPAQHETFVEQRDQVRCAEQSRGKGGKRTAVGGVAAQRRHVTLLPLAEWGEREENTGRENWPAGRTGKKRKERAAGLHRGKEKGGGGLGRMGNLAQEGFGKIVKTFLFPILIQIQIRFKFRTSSTRTLNYSTQSKQNEMQAA